MAESNLTVAQILGDILEKGFTVVFKQQKNKKYAILVMRGKEKEIAFTLAPFNTRIVKAVLTKINRKIEDSDGTE